MTQHRFYGLRGEAYGLEKVRIYEQEKEAIAKYFWEVRNKSGKFTARDLGAIAVKFQLPLTIMNDFLSKATDGKFPAGTWDRLKDRKCKARDLGVVWE